MGDKPKRLISIIYLIALVLGLLPAGALAAGGGYGVSEFAFYYLYDSNLPVHPESPGKGPEFYGPSGNDVPFRMASVDIDELLERYPAGAADWESRKVISAVTCGLGMENNEAWWSGVVQCMDAGSREYFTSDSFGKLFQGYVLKGGLLGAYPNHLDGVIIVPPPLYLVELNDSYGGSFIATLSSEAPHTAQQVQAEIESYLKTAYGAQQIEWAGNYGVFRGAERTYSFSLRYEPGLGPDGGLNYEYKGEGYNLAMVTLSLTPHYTVRYDANGGAAPEYTPADADRLSVTVCPQADEVTLLYRVIVTAVNGNSALVTDPGAAYAGYSGEGFSVSENPDGSVSVTWANAGTQAAPASAELYFTRSYTGLPGDRAGLELTNSAEVTVGSRTESAGAAVKVHTVSSLEKTVLSVLPEGVTLPEGVRPDEVTTTGGSAEVLLGAEQTGAVLLYELAVTGTPGAVFTVDDPGAVFIGGDGTGIIGPDGRAVLYCCREFARPAEGWSGVLENTASVFCLSSTASVSVKRLDGEIELTPADITIYMGGDKGYEAVVGGGDEPVESSSLPEPLFHVTLPGGGSADGLTLRGEGGRSWTLELAGGDAEGSPLYYIRPAPNQDPVRVQVTDDLGQVHISDSFDPGGLGGLSMQFRLDIYRGGAGAVTAELGGGIYTVRTKSGSLEVRYVVENMSGNPVYGVSAALSEPLPAGEAAVTAPAGTSYMLNDTGVPASGTGVGLLFDGLYDSSGSLEALRARVERIMGGAVRYEARYLDLVDADDGNAWVTASGPVTVHWGYPEGTDEHTSFTLLHFAGLHRSVHLLTDDVIANWPKVDNVPVRKTENGLSFEVTPGGFSPFVLVWEEGQSSVTPPVTPSVTPPAALNTKDHFAYMIGYEDGTIRPGNGITRAEAATIFFRLLTDEARGKYRSESSGYTDVASGSWYNNAVSTLSRMGILSGYADGSFRPGAGITRAEFAKLAVSFFEYEGIKAENGFKDVAEGAWYARYVAAAAELGLVNGYEGGIFRPEAGITRAEASAIINRTLGRAPAGTGLLPESEMNTWPDNPADAWYYAHMQEATNSHAYRMSNGAEQWTRRLPEPDWDALQL